MWSLRALFVAVAVLAAACGSTTASPIARSAPSTERVETTTDAPVRIEVVHAFRRAIDLGDVPGGRLVLVGGMRLLGDRDGRFTAARTIFEQPLVGAARTHGAWHFADAAGQVYRASDALGDPTPIGTTDPDAALAPAPSRDVLSAIDTHGASLLRFDGTRLAPVATGFAVESASFLDATHVLAIASGGVLAWSGDAAASWRAIVRDERSRGVFPVADGWLVPDRVDRLDVAAGAAGEPGVIVTWETSLIAPMGGIAADGSIASSAAAPGPRWARLQEAVALQLVRSVPAWIAADPDAGWIDGTLVAQVPRTRDVMLVDPVARTLERVENALPSSRCRVRRWGPRVAAVCPYDEDEGEPTARADDGFESDDGISEDDEDVALSGGDGPPAAEILASDDGRTFTHVMTADMRVVLAPDGRGAAWDALSMRPAGATDATHIDAPSVPTTMSGSVVAGLAADGPWVASSGSTRARAVDVAGMRFLARGASRVDLIADGREIVWVTFSSSSARSLVLRGPTSGPLRRVELPPEAAIAGFADAARGLAVGTDVGHLWRTHDGGRTWDALAPLAANEAAMPFEPHSVRCFPERCIVRGEETHAPRIIVWGWDDLPTAPGALRFAHPVTTEPRAPPPPRELDRLRDRVTCAPGTRAPAPAGPAMTGNRFRDANGVGRLLAIGEPGGGAPASARVEWAGEDPRGPFVARSTTTEIAVSAESPSALLLGRDDVVFAVAADGEDARLVAWARRDRPIRPIAAIHGDSAGWLALPLPETRLLFATVVASENHRGSWLAAALFDANGTALAHSTWRWPSDARESQLALVDGADPAVLAGTRRFSLRPDALPSVLDLPAVPATACTRPRARDDALVLHGDAVELRLPNAQGGVTPRRARARLEVGATSWCIRSIELAPDDDRDPSGVFTARPDGSFGGRWSERDETLATTCRIENR